MNNNEIIKRYGSDPKEMTLSLLEYAGLSDRIPNKNSHIGIKPNLVCPTPASYGATTHPEIVEGVIFYLQDHGYNNIKIIEGSWVGDRTSEAYEYCGYKSLCEKYNIQFVDTQKDTYHTVNCAGMDLNICDIVDDIDFLINVPVLKGHCQTKVTCALKNLKGLIPNSEKRKFHTIGLHKPIAHLSTGIHQDFIVVDHICGDPDFEEGGNPLKTDCVIVATDPVLIDTYASKLLGYAPKDVPYIEIAESLGIGTTDLSQSTIRVIDEKCTEIKSFSGNDDDPYETNFGPKNRILEVSYAVDDADACSACYGNFVTALYRLKEEGIWREDIFTDNNRISIGQRHKNQTGTFGIGNCCRLFESYIPGCPPSEDIIYKTLKKYFTD